MGISTTPSSIARLSKKAYDHFCKSQVALKQKPFPDWTTFGREMKSLELSLGKLVDVTGEQALTAAPDLKTRHDTVKNPIDNIR